MEKKCKTIINCTEGNWNMLKQARKRKQEAVLLRGRREHFVPPELERIVNEVIEATRTATDKQTHVNSPISPCVPDHGDVNAGPSHNAKENLIEGRPATAPRVATNLPMFCQKGPLPSTNEGLGTSLSTDEENFLLLALFINKDCLSQLAKRSKDEDFKGREKSAWNHVLLTFEEKFHRKIEKQFLKVYFKEIELDICRKRCPISLSPGKAKKLDKTCTEIERLLLDHLSLDEYQEGLKIIRKRPNKKQRSDDVTKITAEESDSVVLFILQHKNCLMEKKRRMDPNFALNQSVIWNRFLIDFQQQFGKTVQRHVVRAHYLRRKQRLRDDSLLSYRYQMHLDGGLSIEEKLKKLGNICTATELLLFEDMILEENSLHKYITEHLSVRVENDIASLYNKRKNFSPADFAPVVVDFAPVVSDKERSENLTSNKNPTAGDVRFAIISLMKDQRLMLEAQRTMMEVQIKFNSNVSTILKHWNK